MFAKKEIDALLDVGQKQVLNIHINLSIDWSDFSIWQFLYRNLAVCQKYVNISLIE
jgi:hypothetical protein